MWSGAMVLHALRYMVAVLRDALSARSIAVMLGALYARAARWWARVP